MMNATRDDPVRLGVIGLGRGFMLTLPAITGADKVQLAAAVSSSEAKRQAFTEQFGAPCFATNTELFSSDLVDAIYVATPHELHLEHVIGALSGGKHVLVEKPMTISVQDARVIVEHSIKVGRHVIVGPSHSFDKPIIEAAKLIRSGRYGPVGMITASYYTDFVFRPRRPEELDTHLGGGAVFNQGAHHADILQSLAGARPINVYAMIGNLDARRPCDGAYTAIVGFDNGCMATMTYSGYGHYDSDADFDWVGELGTAKPEGQYAVARQRLLEVEDESAAKASRGFAGLGGSPEPLFHEHFGNILVSCQKADIKPTPRGIHIFSDDGETFLPLPLSGSPRSEVIEELFRVIRHGEKPVHDAQRGLINVELCAAMYRSVASGSRIDLKTLP